MADRPRRPRAAHSPAISQRSGSAPRPPGQGHATAPVRASSCPRPDRRPAGSRRRPAAPAQGRAPKASTSAAVSRRTGSEAIFQGVTRQADRDDGPCPCSETSVDAPPMRPRRTGGPAGRPSPLERPSAVRPKRENVSKMRGCSRASMPGPLSETTMRTPFWLPSAWTSTRPFLADIITAFSIRCSTDWRMRRSSPPDRAEAGPERERDGDALSFARSSKPRAISRTSASISIGLVLDGQAARRALGPGRAHCRSAWRACWCSSMIAST